METKKTENIDNEMVAITVENRDIGSFVYIIRGKQVMIDSDLAMLY